MLPILLLLIFGLVDLGRAVYAQNALSEAARDGARWGSVQARAGADIPGIEDYTESRIDAVPGVTATAECITTNVFGCSPNDVLRVRAETDYGDDHAGAGPDHGRSGPESASPHVYF